jgi:hypothetical protein
VLRKSDWRVNNFFTLAPLSPDFTTEFFDFKGENGSVLETVFKILFSSNVTGNVKLQKFPSLDGSVFA